MKQADAKEYYETLKHIAQELKIKLAPIEDVLKHSPDEFLGWKFREILKGGAKEPRKLYAKRTKAQLIKAFFSHSWHVTADIYGHNGLCNGGKCLNCGRKFQFPSGGWDDDFVLAYHYVYGNQKRFGGRITRCKGPK